MTTKATPPRTTRNGLTAPLFLPYQRVWMSDPAKTRLCEKGRRVGLDYCEAFDLVADRMTGQTNADAWYVSHTEEAGREFMEYVRTFAKVWGRVVEIITGVDADDKQLRVMSVTLPATTVRGLTREPRITALSANPRAFRGKGGDIRISELAFHERAEELWTAAASCTTWGGTLAAWSTHNGEDSFFNRLVQMGRRRAAGQARPSDVDLSLHTVTLESAIEQGLVERINLVSGQHHTRESFLAEVRGKYPDQAAFEEENLCKPRGEAGSYFPYELLRPCVYPGLPVTTEDESLFFRGLWQMAGGADAVYAGCDVGRKHDRFSVVIGTRHGGAVHVGPILSWQGRRFDAMEGVLTRLLRADMPAGRDRTQRLRRLAIDEAGLGMQMAERLTDRFRGRVEGVNTGTGSVREDLFTRGRAMVEERTIHLPDDPGLLSELNGVRRIQTAARHDRYDLARNADGHSDRCMGLMLMLYAAGQPAGNAFIAEGSWR